jgi:hypothetical protein
MHCENLHRVVPLQDGSPEQSLKALQPQLPFERQMGP